MQTNNAHEYTDEQLQSAIDAAFLRQDELPFRNLQTYADGIYWPQEAPNRLAVARAFLAALPKPAEADPYARLKSYAAAGARIRCTTYGDGWTDWALNKHAAWSWCKPVDQYEVHPDDLHMVPEYVPGTEVEKPWMSEARQIAAQCWCDPETSGTPMDARLAEAVAKRIQAWMETSAQTQATASVSGLSKPADNSPPWIPHDGKGCPLKDEEVEEWGFKFRSGDTVEKATDAPSSYTWVHDGDDWWGDKVAYRVLRWKPGHGPQAAQYYMPKLPNPLAQPEPATFEAHGKTLTRHTPGDPCPCDPSALVYVAFKDGTFSSCPDFAEVWGWGTVLTDNEWIIGWRYADEPAKPTQSQQAWTPRPGDVVRLKSGGPEMTVCCLTPEGATGCVWFDDGGCLDTKAFPAACLTPAKEGQP